MHRRGQVFLMATIIIVGILLSLGSISNKSVVRKEPEAFFDLADEIGFETKRVLDYGVINPSQGSVENLAGRLLENYSEYISNEDVAFVYGNRDEVYAISYNQVNAVAVSVLSDTFITLPVITRNIIEAKREVGTNIATVRIRDNDFDFDLKPGQNFYFVLIKDEDGEQFVTVK